MFTGMRPVERGLALEAGAAAVALLEEAEVFDVEDLGDREAVVHLGAVDVARADAGHRVRALRRARRVALISVKTVLLVQVRVVGRDAEAGDVHGLVGELARPARRGTSSTAAAPSVCGQQSSRCSGWHTGADFSTSSTVISFWKCAYGSRAPL